MSQQQILSLLVSITGFVFTIGAIIYGLSALKKVKVSEAYEKAADAYKEQAAAFEKQSDLYHNQLLLAQENIKELMTKNNELSAKVTEYKNQPRFEDLFAFLKEDRASSDRRINEILTTINTEIVSIDGKRSDEYKTISIAMEQISKAMEQTTVLLRSMVEWVKPPKDEIRK